MAINSISNAAQYIPQQATARAANAESQQVKTLKDSDGDRDGTKANQVEKAGEAGKAAESVQASTLTSSTVGSVVNIKA
jgi:hypothetical protein